MKTAGAMIFMWLCVAASACAQEFLTEEAALKLAFPGAEKIEKKTVILTADQQTAVKKNLRADEVKRIYTYFAGLKDGKPVGYAVIDNVMGKSKPITYMAAVGTDGKIRQVEILVYRESHGGEVRHENFRAQYKDKTAQDALRVNTDIMNISGATISCRSVTDGVHNILVYLSVLCPAEKPAALQAFSRAQSVMGTVLTLTVYAPDENASNRATTAAFAEAMRLDGLLSTYKDDSEISRLNRSAGGDAVAVSPDTLDILTRSVEFSQTTSGAFDITVGPLINLWQKASAGDHPSLPAENDIQAARAKVGFTGLEIQVGAKTARLKQPGAGVNLGGVGKGYALDKMAAILKQNGVQSALLNFGGQVLVIGLPPEKTAWEISLRDARTPDKAGRILKLPSGSVSTSADYENGVTIQGRRYSHILDPRTGKPVESMLAATVWAATATEADALSTALFVMGPDTAAALAKEQKLAALIQADNREEIVTEPMKRLASPEKK